MRTLLICLLAAVVCLPACETDNKRKKKARPPLPGEEISSLPHNRPTRPTEMGNPFGLDRQRR